MDRPKSKILMWTLVYPHLATGKLTYTIGAPTSILCFGDIYYELSWRDSSNYIAYYNKWWVGEREQIIATHYGEYL